MNTLLDKITIQNKLILPTYTHNFTKPGCFLFYSNDGLKIVNNGELMEYVDDSDDDETQSTVSAIYPNLKKLAELEEYESMGFRFMLQRRVLDLSYAGTDRDFSTFYLDFMKLINLIRKYSRDMHIRRIEFKFNKNSTLASTNMDYLTTLVKNSYHKQKVNFDKKTEFLVIEKLKNE
jgi:hypothetical protein